jgi:hypothetical protein
MAMLNNQRVIQLASFWTQLLIISENIGKGPKSWSTRFSIACKHSRDPLAWKSSPPTVATPSGFMWNFPTDQISQCPQTLWRVFFCQPESWIQQKKIKIWSNSTRLGWWETSEQRSFKRQGGPIFLRRVVPRMRLNMGVEAAQRPMWDDQNGSTS